MHPFDCLIDRWEVIYTVCLLQSPVGAFVRCTWLPLASLLDEWDSGMSSFVLDSKQYAGSFARDQLILLFVYCGAVLGEDGDVVIVASFANPHQSRWEFCEGICLGYFHG